jgi:GT2 family glycosyltransferase
VRIIRLSKNYGFAIANAIAYRLRDPLSKYVALINNDVYPEPDSLRKMIEILEKSEKIAGVQGVLLTWDGSHVLTYGGFITDLGLFGGVATFMESSIIRRLKPIAVAYVDGAYSVYKVEALEKAGGLFLPYFFMWGDDYELGIRLWRAGYILIAFPIIAGRHYGGASTITSKGDTIYEPPRLPYTYEYWYWMSNIAVTAVLYNRLYMLQIFKRILIMLIGATYRKSKAILRGLVDGIIRGFKLRRKIIKPNLWWIGIPREPRIKMSAFRELALIFSLHSRYGYKASRIYYIIVSRALVKKYLKY